MGLIKAHTRYYYQCVWAFFVSFEWEGGLMATKPTYEELEQKIKQLEKEVHDDNGGEAA